MTPTCHWCNVQATEHPVCRKTLCAFVWSPGTGRWTLRSASVSVMRLGRAALQVRVLPNLGGRPGKCRLPWPQSKGASAPLALVWVTVLGDFSKAAHLPKDDCQNIQVASFNTYVIWLSSPLLLHWAFLPTKTSPQAPPQHLPTPCAPARCLLLSVLVILTGLPSLYTRKKSDSRKSNQVVSLANANMLIQIKI